MSGQSMMLEQLISQFKLKNASRGFGGLPPTSKKLPSYEQRESSAPVELGTSGDTFGKY